MTRINDWGIYSRVIFTAIVPVIIFSVVFGVYINEERNQDLLHELTERGNLIASNLATASEFAVATRSEEQIRVLVESAINQKDVVGVRVLDETGKQLLKRGGYDTSGKGDVSQYLADIVSTVVGGADLSLNDDSQNTPADSSLLLGTIEVYVSDESYIARQKSILFKTIAFILTGIIVSIGLAMLIGHTLVKPVRDVIDVVSSVTHGNLMKRISNVSGGELGKLQSDINEMSETILSAKNSLEHEIKQATSELEKTVDKLQDKNRELDLARNEAMQAKDAKSEFLANMSHEIRTPLNAIIGFSRQLGKTNLDGKQSDFSKTITSAAKQLLTVIDDILSFSKLESGKLTIVADEFRLRDCLDNVISMLSHASSEKEIELVLLVDANVPDVVIGDADRITQVLTNLISNAIKFTNYGTVVVHVSVDDLYDSDEVIKVSVTDTGCGISKEAQQELFSPFYQENQKSSKQYGGTGLGLVICQRLISLMGGKLDFKSEVGIGSEFFFSLPLDFVLMHDYQQIVSSAQIFVLDGNSYSRRAIRNNLIHMGLNVLTVDRNERLIETLCVNDVNVNDTYVIVSLPPGYSADDFNKHFYPDIRNNFNGEIIVLVSQPEYSIESEFDDKVKFIDKPVRLNTLSSLFLNESETKKQESDSKVDLFSGFNILVAEDNEFNQKYISSLLVDYGLTVDCVNNGNQAVNACKQKNFDMILMDLHMPELDGIESTQLIRGLDLNLREVPIIAITADVFANENNTLINSGFTDCMFKPLDESKLVSILKKYLQNVESYKANDNVVRDITADPEIRPKTSIPKNMQDRLFVDLFKQYSELESIIFSKDGLQAREKIHTILGLVCYFKIDNLTKDVEALQALIRVNNFEKAKSVLKNIIFETEKIENSLNS